MWEFLGIFGAGGYEGGLGFFFLRGGYERLVFFFFESGEGGSAAHVFTNRLAKFFFVNNQREFFFCARARHGFPY